MTQPYRYHDLSYGPLGLWQLNGDALDSSGNGYNLDVGIFSGGTTFMHYSDIIPGIRGAWFDGSHFLIHTAYDAALNILGDMTVEAIIRNDELIPGVNPTSQILRAFVSHSGSNIFFTTYGPAFAVGLNASSRRVQALSSQGAVLDRFECEHGVESKGVAHVAARRKSGVWQIFINGQRAGPESATLPTPDGGTNARFRIGGVDPASASGSWLGALASVKLFDKALTDDEIRAEATLTGFFEGPSVASAAPYSADVVTIEGPSFGVTPTSDTFRGGREMVVFSASALVDASRDETFTGASVPAGWTSAGTGTVTPSNLGVVLSTAYASGSVAKLTSPDNDYRYFDAYVNLTPQLPVDTPGSEVVLGALRHETTIHRVDLEVLRGGLRAKDQLLARARITVITTGALLDSGARLITPGTLSLELQLARDGETVYALVDGEPLIDGSRSLDTGAGSITLLCSNETAVATTQGRFRDFRVEAHTSLNGRLLRAKQFFGVRQMRGTIPRATLSEVGAAEVVVFGLFGRQAITDTFTYSLPSAKTVSNEVTRTLRSYDDPTVRDE